MPKRNNSPDTAWPPLAVRDLKPDTPVSSRIGYDRFPTLRLAINRALVQTTSPLFPPLDFQQPREALTDKLVITRYEGCGDWWVIERAAYAGLDHFEASEETTNPARIVDGDLEGPSEEMAALAKALEQAQSIKFKRVRADWTPAGYWLSRPRNDSAPALITHQVAKDLAADIRGKIKM